MVGHQIKGWYAVITVKQLCRVLGCDQSLGYRYIEPINITIDRYSINTPQRIAAFIAQVGHESARLTHVVENLNYSAEGLAKTWPNRFKDKTTGKPNELAKRLHRKPEDIANESYATRLGNGNVASGEGWAYRGRGLIQITGRNNYAAVSHDLGINALMHPELLESPLYAAMSAGWYWDRNLLNLDADVGDIEGMTRRINGGLNGIIDRKELYQSGLVEFMA